MTYKPGRHFLQLPGPTNVPQRVLRAMAVPTVDHRGPDFPELTRDVLRGMGTVFGTKAETFIFPASGSGMWEAALVNTLSPGDNVFAFDQGFFSAGWQNVATKMGLVVQVLPGDWRCAVDPGVLEQALLNDAKHECKAVLVVHNETSTGVTSNIQALGDVIRKTGHPALLLVDAVSSLGSIDFQHDAWGVDVTVSGSQKGLMLPPGLGLLAVSDRAVSATKRATLPRSYWDWEQMRAFNEDGFFPYTPATNMLFGLRESLRMLQEEGLENVQRRHARLAEATREAVAAWGLEFYASQSAHRSNSVTAVVLDGEVSADQLRKIILDRFDMSLGAGLGRLKGKVFRIGHLGDLNDLMLAGTLCGIEMGLQIAGVDFNTGGVDAALLHMARSK